MDFLYFMSIEKPWIVVIIKQLLLLLRAFQLFLLDLHCLFSIRRVYALVRLLLYDFNLLNLFTLSHY
jgi:hypothetical protein